MKLRPYQQSAYDAVHREFAGGRISTIVTLPTGTGKTVVFAHVAKEFSSRGRVLVLAHREELIYQAADKIKAVTGEGVDIEMASQWATLPEHSPWAANFIISSVQTQNASLDDGKRMHRFNPNDFALLVIDEAHHSVAASYRRVVDHFRTNPDLRVLGVTATGDRGDGEGLGSVFDTVAFNYDLHSAIRDGWLVPVRQFSVAVAGLDFSKCRTVGNDLNQADLAAVMEFESSLHPVAHATIERAANLEPGSLAALKDDDKRQEKLAAMMAGRKMRKTLVFTVSVAQAERLAEIFNRWVDGCARFVCGETAKQTRRDMLADYAKNRFSILVNVGVATEGFDDPGIELVVMARPTKSRALYAQMAGRGTRPQDSIAHRLGDIAEASGRRSLIASSQKPSCIAEGQRVLTNVGLVPIEFVTDKMLVWDGIEFVSCGGSIFRGKQGVIDYAGLTATPDHEVYVYDQTGKSSPLKMRKTFGECAAQQIPICVTGVGGQAVREADRCERKHCTEIDPRISADKMHVLRERGTERDTKLEKKYCGVSQMRQSTERSAVANPAMQSGEESMRESKLGCFCALRGQRHSISLRLPARNGNLDSSKSRPAPQYANRSDRQQQALRAWEPAMGHKDHPVQQPTREAHHSNDSQIQTDVSLCWILGRSLEETSRSRNIFRADYSESPSARPIQRKARVFDIINAGPRHRFTVEGLLVSNCEILDFVGNAGRHKLISTADILGDERYDDQVIERAKLLAQQEAVDVEAALQQAELEIDEERQVKAMREQEEYEQLLAEEAKKRNAEAARRAALVATTSYDMTEINAMDPHDIGPARKFAATSGGSSDKQVELLVKLGVKREAAGAFSKRQASAVIEKLKSERCTTGQAKYLRYLGYSAETISLMNFDAASRAIESAKEVAGAA